MKEKEEKMVEITEIITIELTQIETIPEEMVEDVLANKETDGSALKIVIKDCWNADDVNVIKTQFFVADRDGQREGTEE